MAYESVDKLQKALSDDVFYYAKDAKKAAGRALGTMVEIITYYLLKSWQMNEHISIERGLAEYGNAEITHNVEYSLHPVLSSQIVELDTSFPLSASKIIKKLKENGFDFNKFEKTNNHLVDKDGILRNACTIATSDNYFLMSMFLGYNDKKDKLGIQVYEQHRRPYAIFECKRVGVEEGQTKGPQTIEKAKQGAYVARTASSLQRLRTETGEAFGIIYKSDNSFLLRPYQELLEEVINTNDLELLRKFILTIGVVSNHGNWFTAENQNKELKVLAQSYDWLLFLTDDGLAEFIETLLLSNLEEYKPIRSAFAESYKAEKVKNRFTKVQMQIDAHFALNQYFHDNLSKIEKWFNIISPVNKEISVLKEELHVLSNKDWTKIL